MASEPIEQPIGQPLSNLEKWLQVADVVALAGVSHQTVKKALSGKKWRGAGRKAPQVHVDSLPADLRESWYLEHGIVLHQKVLPQNGDVVMVAETAHQTDARFEATLVVARWRHNVIRPVLALKAGSPERASMILDTASAKRMFPNGSRKAVTKQTIYNWVRDFEAEGLNGLVRKRRTDNGAKRQKVTRAATQFGLCNVNRRQVEHHRSFGLLAIKDKDNAKFQDKYVPSIRRDYSSLLPRQIVVGDVHPVDIMMRGADGSVVYPKAIAWYDVATNEVHMTFVLCEPGEGIRREHVAQSFEAMVEEWGFPEMLYLDNGSEYSWDEMISGFTQLSKLTQGGMKVFDLDGDPDVAKRVANGREAIVRSMPYNAKGKPGIEGVFGNLEQVFFATIPGWTAGDRMSKKTHAKGKDPIAFDGGAHEFLAKMGEALEWYHKRPQYGRLAGMSPNEALSTFIDKGWGKTTLSRPEVLALAFSEEIERIPERGRIVYTPRRGPSITYYADELLGLDHKITMRVPAFNPEFVFCFAGDDLICQAFPERTFGVLDGAGALEVNRRCKVFRRQIADTRRHVALLSLTDETKRHIGHMPDAPEAPVAAVIDAGILDRMADMEEAARKALANEAAKPKAPSQWKTGPNVALENLKYEDE